MPYLKLEILSKLFLNINSNNQEIETLQKIETSLKKYSKQPITNMTFSCTYFSQISKRQTGCCIDCYLSWFNQYNTYKFKQ